MNKVIKILSFFILINLVIGLVSCNKVEEPSETDPTITEIIESTLPTVPSTEVIEKLEYISFGKYPQTIVEDPRIIYELKLLTKTNDQGYYEYGGAEYAKAIAYPFYEYFEFSNGWLAEEGEEFYFKVEEIKWKVLEQENGDLIVITDKIIDNIQFNPSVTQKEVDGKKKYANDYLHSDIRAWLNNDFYNSAFSIQDQKRIYVSLVNNKGSTTINRNNIYSVENTNDHVYMLSYQEALKIFFDNDDDRIASITDYALARGAAMCNLEREGFWWLRSPYYGYSYYVGYVDCYGEIFHYNVDDAHIGVRPVIKIKMPPKNNNQYPVEV